MDINGFLQSTCQETVVFRYLEMLAERTAALEQRLGLKEVERLREENRLLQQQLSLLKKPPMVQLLAFLPVFFVSFWSKVSPGELALLAEVDEAPAVPSVVAAPDFMTLERAKRDFLALPELDRLTLLLFCRSIQKNFNLKWHPQVRELFEK